MSSWHLFGSNRTFNSFGCCHFHGKVFEWFHIEGNNFDFHCLFYWKHLIPCMVLRIRPGVKSIIQLRNAFDCSPPTHTHSNDMKNKGKKPWLKSDHMRVLLMWLECWNSSDSVGLQRDLIELFTGGVGHNTVVHSNVSASPKSTGHDEMVWDASYCHRWYNGKLHI